MNDSIFRISLDIHEHGSQAVLKAKYADTGRKLCISLRSGGTPYIIADGCYAAFKATKPDGKILYNACTIEDNEIIYEFTEQTCTAIGRSRCEIVLYGSDDKLITSPRFALLVDGTIYPDGRVESTDEFSALTEMVSDGLEVIEDATEATGKANEAAEDAKVATQNATNATNAANQAATAATQAAQSASTATENANAATGRANEATQAANNATNDANQAAENANEATTNVVRIVKNTMAAGEVSGESVTMDDAVEFGFIGFRIFGKTTQDGTPTPDAPVELVNIGDSGSISVNVIGKNEAQSMTIATPNGLPGIPVAEGGNYTDANGQQWVCDEKDFAMGVYVQRVKMISLVDIMSQMHSTIGTGDIAGGETIYIHTTYENQQELIRYSACLSDRLPSLYIYNVDVEGIYIEGANQSYSIRFRLKKSRLNEASVQGVIDYLTENPIRVMYILATPIETPLSAEEIAAYSALHTYRDNTTVTNDASAHMELEYVMDAKKYIDSLVVSSTIHQATVE